MTASRNVPVLVVDDDDDIRGTLRFLLEDAGYTVEEVGDPNAGIEYLRRASQPHVVLLDHLFPNGTGMEILRAAHGDSSWGQYHAFILMTASVRYEDVHAAVNALAPGHIPLVRKPFDLDEVLATLSHVAGKVAGQQRATTD